MKKKILKIFTMISLALVMALTTCLINFNSSKEENPTRTIEISSQSIDYQSILDDFDNAQITKEGSLTTFTGTKTINANDLLNFDNVSSTDIDEDYNSTVSYHLTYDKDSNIVTISAEMINENGEIYLDEISGVAFINANNEIDAVMNVEGESVLLSEMNNAGLIDNCGWFSRLVKKVVKVAVQVTVAAAVVVATAAVVVATAGAAAPALVAAGVGITTTTATVLGTVAGAAAGALFYSTIGTAALQAGTAISETIASGAEIIVEKSTNNILSFVFDNIEYTMTKLTKSNLSKYQDGNIYLATIGLDGNTYISSIKVSNVVAVWFMRITKYGNYVSAIGTGIYTLTTDTAYQIAMDASNGGIPVYGPPHGVSTATKLYFEHWHDAKHLGHAFWGNPV